MEEIGWHYKDKNHCRFRDISTQKSDDCLEQILKSIKSIDKRLKKHGKSCKEAEKSCQNTEFEAKGHLDDMRLEAG